MALIGVVHPFCLVARTRTTPMIFQRKEADGQDLFRPGIFAMVMATGIVSLACHGAGLDKAALTLYRLNCGFYVLFWISAAVKTAAGGKQFFTGLSRPSETIDLFTIQAGTSVLGSQFMILSASVYTAAVLCGLSVILWLFLMYLMLPGLSVQERKGSEQGGIDGSWFLLTVSTESLSILMSLLAPHLPSYRFLVICCSAGLFMTGAMLYLMILPLVFYRLFFLPLLPEQFHPSYWITMGAAAITTLSAVFFSESGLETYPFPALPKFFMGLMTVFWSFASFWLPLLVVLEIFYHRGFRLKVRYMTGLWSLVFPIGMYVVCTDHVGRVLHLPALSAIAGCLVYPALAVWVLTFFGFVVQFLGRKVGNNQFP